MTNPEFSILRRAKVGKIAQTPHFFGIQLANLPVNLKILENDSTFTKPFLYYLI